METTTWLTTPPLLFSFLLLFGQCYIELQELSDALVNLPQEEGKDIEEWDVVREVG